MTPPRSAISRQALWMPARPPSKASIQATSLPTAALTSCKTIRKSSFPSSQFPPLRARVQPREPVSPIHHAAGGDRSADGGDLAGRYRGVYPVAGLGPARGRLPDNPDRKSTRLNSSHLVISYAVFCLKKKNR